MRLTEAGLISKCSAKFSQSCIRSPVSTAGGSECSENCLGGIIKKGQLGWLVKGPLLEVHSLRSGQKISSFHFGINLGFENCIITSVVEVEETDFNCCLLAIGILFGDSPGSVVALYSVKESKVVRCIEIKEKVTSCALVSPEICKRTVLHMLQGCLAIGTEIGKLFLLDLNLSKCEEVLLSTRRTEEHIELVPCHTVSSTLEFTHIRLHHKHSKQENVNFGIELERIENAGLILSMLSVTPLLTLAVGLEDGRMILYDLSELQPIHISYPREKLSPLVKLTYMEPPDDPRACIYMWAYHENSQTAFAVMHSLMYDKKMIEDDGICLCEGFQSCKMRLTLPMYEEGSLPVTCRKILKYSSNDDEEILSLCLFAWKSKKLSHIILFDINQWYKEEMPVIGDWRDNLTYLAHFQLEDQYPLDVYIDHSTVASFNSIQRPEEHFYPISLCLDCIVMETSGSTKFHWPGLQNRALELLSSGGPTAILDPSYYFNEVMGASLMPQFSDHGYNSTVSINTQREILLSIALEYNCFGLLKECAKCWADGSCLGRKPFEGLSLSTLTEWIWNRASKTKSRCNNLCATLFDHSGIHIDQRTQKELSCLCRQLKILADLYNVILTKCKEYIPETELDALSNQYSSIRTASEYQEVLQWLLNIGLLPEGYSDSEDDKTYSRIPLVPYPYKILKSYYMNQRTRFGKLNKGFISSRTQSCRILYIDSFIEHECNANELRDHWVESGGNGLYPPPSLQAMLRTLLVPDVPIENKYVLFIYLFLDLNMAIEDESYSPIVQNLIKFPAVFKMNASLIKTVQAFWNLDHCQFEVALDDIISPFSQDRKLSQWQQELLIEALLAQDQPSLALQALQARVSPVSSLLELKTFLANDLVAEAYHLQRSKNDPELLRTFLNGCLYLGKWGILRDLALTEEEGKIVEEFLRQANSSNAENLHFVYLLQRSKYIEAISYLDELSKSKQNQRPADLETPNLVLSAYNLTMTPAVKQISSVYCNIRNRIKPLKAGASHPMPFSCELLKNGIRDITGGIYHSSALSTDQASVYWDDDTQKESNRLLDTNNVPFIRQPQLDVGDLTVRESLSYPEVYKPVSKRRLNDSSDLETDIENTMNNAPKRQKIIEGTDFVRNKKSFQTINTSLLTRFKTKGVKDCSTKESSRSATCSRHDSKEQAVHLLSTPFVKSRRIDLKDDLDTIDNTYERVCTPHGILKVKSMLRTSSHSPTPVTSRETHKSISREVGQAPSKTLKNNSEIIDEEKTIRFDLPRRSDITLSSVSLEDSLVVKSTGTSLLFGGPQRRKPIRSIESSAISASDMDEFFSPPQSQDTSKIDEEMDIDTDAFERSKEVQEEEEEEENSENEFQNNFGNEIGLPSKNLEISESNNIANTDGNKIDKSSDSSLKNKRLNTSDGPKARRPLRRSDSPIEGEFLKDISDRRARSRSRSKTPDIFSSPSRRSSRLAEKADRNIGSRKPLSRMVLEKTVTTAIETLKEVEDSGIQSTKIFKTETSEAFNTKNIEVQDIELKSFVPKITSSQDPSSLLRNHPWQNKVDDLSTPKSDNAYVDDIPLVEVPSNTITTPVPILVDESVLGEPFTQNRDYHLMATMDICSFSGGDVTLEEFEPPGNLLSDSESGDSKNMDNKKIKKASEKIDTDTANSTIPTKVENKREDPKKKDKGDDENNQNEKESNESKEENVANEVDNADSEEDNVDSEEDKVDSEEHKGSADYWEALFEQSGYPTDADIDQEMRRAEEAPFFPIADEYSEGSYEEDLSIEYSVKSSDSEEEDNKNVIINISSATDDSSGSVEEFSDKKKNKEEFSQNLVSSKDEENNVSDLLYGDIDQNESVNEDNGKNETDDLNNAAIFEKTKCTTSQLEISESSAKPASSEKSKMDTSISLVGVIEENNHEKKGEECKGKEYIDKFDAKPLQIASVKTIREGMTLNFLTGEEEIIEDAVNSDNNRTLKKSDTIDTISGITTSVTSSNVSKSDHTALSTSNAICMEVDEKPLDSVNSSSIYLNEPMNTNSNQADIPHNAGIVKEQKKENEQLKESPMKLVPSVPMLIVSPPDDSNDGELAHVSETERARSEVNEKIGTQRKEDEAENEMTESVKPQQNEIIESNTNNSNKVLEQYSEENKHVMNISCDREEAGTSKNWLQISQHSPSTNVSNPNADMDKKDVKIIQSTVPDDDSEENNIKLRVSDEEKSVGSDNKNSDLISPSNRESPDRYTSIIEPITPTAHRILRNRRARSESIEIESDIISSDVRTPEKFQRGKSVPRMEVLGTPKSNKIRRLSESSSYLSPSKILTRRQSQLLERIEEDNSLDTPSKHTRSRVRLNSNDSDQAPSTPNMNNNKRTRRSSISSTGTPDTTTPRNLRGRSVLSEDNVPATPKRSNKRLSLSRENLALEEPKLSNKSSKSASQIKKIDELFSDEEMSNTSNEKADKTPSKSRKNTKGKSSNSGKDQGDLDKKTEVKKVSKKIAKTKENVEIIMEVDSSSSDEVVSQKSIEVVKRNKKTVQKASSSKTLKNDGNVEKESNDVPNILLMEDLSASRRLTRNQHSILEKSLSSPIAKIEPKKISKRRSSDVDADSHLKKADHESEVESIASNKSRRSSIDSKKRTTRSSVKEQQDDDASSVASSTISKRSNQSKKASVKSSKIKSLKAIPEEEMTKHASVSSDDDTEESPKEIPKKRGRPKKSIK